MCFTVLQEWEANKTQLWEKSEFNNNFETKMSTNLFGPKTSFIFLFWGEKNNMKPNQRLKGLVHLKMTIL